MSKIDERRQAQQEINKGFDAIMAEMEAETTLGTFSTGRRLRSCQAEVYTSEHFYILRSYNTIIACIDRRTDTLYDFLRKVYGYTATSAQHVSKFSKDYGAGKWGCEHKRTWMCL